ncbi:MAG: MFS transporter [Betaproteobacteria bacterium]
MNNNQWIKSSLPILLGVSLMLSLSTGMRQSLGVFMPPITQNLGVSVSQFTLAIAIQNLSWGLTQPFIGAWAIKVGFKKVMMIGSFLYLLGVIVLATAQGVIGVTIGAGFLIGCALACNGSGIGMAVATRAVPVEKRSLILGFVSAAGSLGALIAAPIGQVLTQEFDWRIGMVGFIVMAVLIIPGAWYAGGVDQKPILDGSANDDIKPMKVVIKALKYPPFTVMTIAYFVCGMQLVFLTTHLPSYLALCGLDPMLSAQSLAVIGGFNALGSLFFGWMGGRYNKLFLLGMIYVLRSIGIAYYFYVIPSPTNTLIFAAYIGFLWLGVVPLVSGSIAEMFGVKWQAMLVGIAFIAHQLGSFVGAFGGGLMYDALGSYDLALQIGVSVGLVAGIAQALFALSKPRPPPSLLNPVLA